ncbi:dihydroneopterin aldolase [Dehalococcoidia bacterium]|nr:dihydroneopterin aldolase [Dehalococcoidia bacterium]
MHRDSIQLNGMSFYGYHGVSEAERELGQRFVVDLEIYRDLSLAGESDNLDDTVNYTNLYKIVKKIVEDSRHELLESLAESITKRVLEEFTVDSVKLTVKKPSVPIKGSLLDYAGITIFREQKGSP